MEYVVQCRYEFRAAANEVKWTSWFAVSAKKYSEAEIDDVIAELNKATADMDRRTHLKHEYRKYDAAVYEDDIREKYADAEKNKEINIALKKKKRKK